jgi:hypothetical protein
MLSTKEPRLIHLVGNLNTAALRAAIKGAYRLASTDAGKLALAFAITANLVFPRWGSVDVNIRGVRREGRAGDRV